MSNIQKTLQPTETVVVCVLSASDSYIETLNIKAVESQPWMVELIIKTQLLSAKSPEEKRIKSRTCIERNRLVDIQSVIGTFLQRSASLDTYPLRNDKEDASC
jgi:hypothetical protein